MNDLLCAIGQDLIARGRRIHFTTSALLVQDLLVAKRDLKLSRFIKRLAAFEGLIIDDLGYVQRAVKKWKCCSRCWRNATNVAAF